jgi:hypothetical protein
MARTPQLRPEEVRQLAEGWGIDPRFVLAIYGQESSSGKNPATSSTGNRGAFQMSPATFKRFNPGGDIDDPVDNANGAMAYMKHLLDTYGDYGEAAEAYFGGAPIRVRGHDYADPSGTRMSQYRDQVMGRMGLSQDGELPRQWSSSPLDQMRAGPQVGLPPSYLPPSEYAPGLSQLADDAIPTASLEDLAVQTPIGGATVTPRENPVSAMLAKMYGATDPDTGLPMDVALGLRNADTPDKEGDAVHQHLQKLVDTTLNGMDFG